MKRIERTQILIIGAGPAGALAGALLRAHGHEVLIIERDSFPRFSIGESLLPQCMKYLEKAGLLQRVVEAGFQHKNGASFSYRGAYAEFDFRDKWTPGWGTTYEVQRARFDEILARGAEAAGATLRFGHLLTALTPGPEPLATIRDAAGDAYQLRCDFVLDASGFGRTLPRLLGLEKQSTLPPRVALFTHLEDRIAATSQSFDRNKIRITTHPEAMGVWYWLIPFSDGRSSIGVVGEAGAFGPCHGDAHDQLRGLVAQEPSLAELLASATWDTQTRELKGYSASVTSMHGPGFALLGNAGEFLDPIFSSGVTIAMVSASLAADCLHRHILGEAVDWEADFAMPLKVGVETFRTFVAGWYDGSLQRVIFHRDAPPRIRRFICSILAGYAWDRSNPLVAQPSRLFALDRQGALARPSANPPEK